MPPGAAFQRRPAIQVSRPPTPGRSRSRARASASVVRSTRHDPGALQTLKQPPLALNLYAWATYHAFNVTQAGKPAFTPWTALAAQIGGDYGRLDHFVTGAKAALRKVQTVYPALQVGDAAEGFVVKPSKPAVPSRRVPDL